MGDEHVRPRRAQDEIHEHTWATSRPAVALRPAGLADCERVYEYNFAADVRAVSGSQVAVPYTDHARWFARRIADPKSPIWIVEQTGEPVGTVRIDSLEAGGRISIALAAEARSRGIGRRAIELACATWGAAVIAEIHPSNVRSRSCFLACGFVPRGHHEPLDVFAWEP